MCFVQTSIPTCLLNLTQYLCVVCGTCVRNCPSGILTLENKRAIFTEQEKCVGCYACFQKCPVHAVVDEKKKLSKIQQYKFDAKLIKKQARFYKIFYYIKFYQALQYYQ
ncbi:4Fe-4S_ferredoxin iron-sulfur binding domain protein [Hexamita inflata]|uniref:4Fe-4S ferredoxin iron-sulfur binding domain protein n=1 Tax=Hexamita inflata TaxID=28002 RepID=A0AA86QJ04_9EUKA|nr:4Fe-4S ferredoxin iron-sulfur binding domain protein [Hexamita inflata]CAI9970404.1 4Fe-4S ferredoxin iron-sulfur binding domain protein [Hexamita inflata]